jgi:hypothetical protein
MVAVLVNILIILVIGGALAGIIQYAPFFPEPFKRWAIYAVGAVVLVLIILILIPLINGAATGITPVGSSG